MIAGNSLDAAASDAANAASAKIRVMDRRAFLQQLAAAFSLTFSLHEANGESSASAEEVARRSFDLLRNDTSEAFVRAIDDAALAEFKVRFLALFTAATGVELDELAKKLAYDSFAELEKAAPRTLLTTLLDAWRRENPEAVALLQECQVKTLGIVTQGTTAYVPYRLVKADNTWADLRIHPKVIVLERQPSGWMVQVNSEGLELGEALRACDFQMPQVHVDVLGLTRDDDGEVYTVNRTTLKFPSGDIPIIGATYANTSADILAAANSGDLARVARILQPLCVAHIEFQIMMLKNYDSLERARAET